MQTIALLLLMWSPLIWGRKIFKTSDESQTTYSENLYGMFMKTVIFLSDTADIDQTKGGNNEQFAHLDMTDTFSHYNFSLEAMGIKAVNESP